MNKVSFLRFSLISSAVVIAQTFVPTYDVSGTRSVCESPYQVTGDIIIQNRAIGVENFDKLRIDRCYFFYNRAFDIVPSGPPGAGVIGMTASDIPVQHCTLESNISSYRGAVGS